MFFSKNIPEAPPITSEREYIQWFVEYSEKIAHIRDLYKNNMAQFISVNTDAAMKMLREYPTGDQLFDRVSHLATSYETKMKPFVDRRGGLAACPGELLGAAVSLLMNTAVGIEFLEKKYRHQEAMQLFAAVR